MIRFNLLRLKKELLLFVTCLFLSLTGAYYSLVYKNNINVLLEDKIKNISNLQKKHIVDLNKRKTIANFGPTFVLLEKKGFLNPESRLIWLEALKIIAELVEISDIKYHFEPIENALVMNNKIDLNHIVLHKSHMTIEFSVLHEGDLFLFFNQLSNQTKSIFHIDKCDIKARVENLKSENLSSLFASCELSLYSVSSTVGANANDVANYLKDVDLGAL